jgi:hypothetical protein
VTFTFDDGSQPMSKSADFLIKKPNRDVRTDVVPLIISLESHWLDVDGGRHRFGLRSYGIKVNRDGGSGMRNFMLVD